MRGAVLPFLLVLAFCFPGLAQEEISPAVGEILKKAHGFADQGKAAEALGTLDEALLQHPDKTFDRFSLLNYKFELLNAADRYEEALNVCLEKANIVASPRQALLVAGAYMRTNDPEHALEWLETSVQRGLLSCSALTDDHFKSLQGNPRFTALLDRVKKKNGLGLPAKSFSARTIDGQEISLGQFQGKVVLLDFWATWCAPCLKQMPLLKSCCQEFKESDFAIVGISGDRKPVELQNYLKKNGISWLIIDSDSGGFEKIATIYGVKNIPATFLIDKKGVLRYVNLAETELRNAIAELVKE